jgi:hypothetical protein
MPLNPGVKLGQYEIVEAIGAGGMDFPRLCQEESNLVFVERLAQS